jgi:sarcosine oxidase subunit alpha
VTGFRLPAGGSLVERARQTRFTFDGRELQGLAGDTLASALLANGRRLIGRSFKYHRPRGLVSAGPEEPNGLVTLRSGGRQEPNIPATSVELFDGLEARSQNRWPSLRFDAQSVNRLFSPLLAAGFYYKTFMGPRPKSWMFYEKFIRRSAGLGRAGLLPDPDRYEKLNAWCDVLVVGAGPAGLTAALAAARGGARVILADEQAQLGLSLLSDRAAIDGTPTAQWRADRLAELSHKPDVTLMPRTTVWGVYDGGVVAALERVADHLATPPPGTPRQRFWRLHCRAVVLATGAVERPLVFAGNDVPGVMLAGALQRYADLYGVAAGRRVAIFTTNDGGYRAASALAARGVSVVSVIDPRRDPPSALAAELDRHRIPLHAGQVVAAADGVQSLGQVRIAAWDTRGGKLAGAIRAIEADTLGVSGGWTPLIQLATQAGARPRWDDARSCFLADELPRNWHLCGAAAGLQDLGHVLRDGLHAGRAAATSLGFTVPPAEPPEADPEPAGVPPVAIWEIPKAPGTVTKAFVDLQGDVTVDDVKLARREGFESVEHLKRYTTLGMATDQGRTSNLNGLAIMARERNLPIAEIGTTRYRPPYVPVAIGALAGHEIGAHFRPTRLTPMHGWHVSQGGDMQAAGLWLRPRAYLRPGETVAQAYVREAEAVRARVGIVDVSTLGKIEVQGPDASRFLDRVYCNPFASLPVGKARYGLMLREDGCILDDGTAWRLGETHYLVTTTTANAATVLSHMEFLLAAVWPELRVQVTSVTDQWAGMAVAGPNSRDVLQAALAGIDLSHAALPLMGVREARCDGHRVLVARLSFSGERAYELFCGWRQGERVWRRLLAAGEPFGILPYGLEALGALRIEKGHVAGAELDGRTTPDDLGLGRMVARKKAFIGKAMLNRPGLLGPDRHKLVGLVSRNAEPVRAGSVLVASPDAAEPGRNLGRVTSWTWSPVLNKHVALGLLEGGLDGTRRELWATYPLKGWHVPVEVVAPCMVDPEGRRLDG